MAKVTFDWGSDLSSDDEEDAAAAGGWQPGSQEEDPGGQEEDSGAGLGLGQEEGEPYTPTNARPRLVQRTISVTCGLGSATNESPRVKVSFHKRRFPSSARNRACVLTFTRCSYTCVNTQISQVFTCVNTSLWPGVHTKCVNS